MGLTSTIPCNSAVGRNITRATAETSPKRAARAWKMRSCHRVELFTSSHQSNTSPSACACSGIAMESSPPGSDVTAVARRGFEIRTRIRAGHPESDGGNM
ncbi:hypothetical protein BHM03_00039107 [Ensete ventricosum]|nr:hypothetical protein BHM03_00039107 [Ensete ventricosum]